MKIYSITILIAAFVSTVSFPQYDWYIQNSGSNRELTDICFVDENNGWISGWTETMLHTTDGGETWAPQTIPPANAYYSVFFTDLQYGWASAYAGKIAHTSDGGNTWVSQTTPTVSDLNNIFFINPDVGWAAGGQYAGFENDAVRTILGTTDGGSTWEGQYEQAYKSPLLSIFFIDSNNGWSTGSNGVLMHTTNGGAVWMEQTIAATFTFYDVFFTNINTGYVVGTMGTCRTMLLYSGRWMEETAGLKLRWVMVKL